LDFRVASTNNVPIEATSVVNVDTIFIPTALTGRLLERSSLEFDPNTGEPIVSLQFNSEGKALFAQITKDNVGNQVGIFLDGTLISAPTVRESIIDGRAQISGGFKLEQAQALVRSLNFGALPVPINLLSTQTVGASLGENALNKSVSAGLWAFIAIAIFLMLWYRLPGFVATIALALYVILNLVLFKLIPITLTSAGLAGFVLSLGMAVDANILIFERMKEEIRRGLLLEEAIREGFKRAWLSIRDSNLSSIITSVILYYFATTSLVKGFALVFFIGVITSMLTAITASRVLLLSFKMKDSKFAKFLFGSATH
jgi:protein-export membrane protein SecD